MRSPKLPLALPLLGHRFLSQWGTVLMKFEKVKKWLCFIEVDRRNRAIDEKKLLGAGVILPI